MGGGCRGVSPPSIRNGPKNGGGSKGAKRQLEKKKRKDGLGQKSACKVPSPGRKKKTLVKKVNKQQRGKEYKGRITADVQITGYAICTRDEKQVEVLNPRTDW